MKKFEEIKSEIGMKWWLFKINAKRKFEETIEWCEEHKELVLASIPVIIVGCRTVGKTVSSINRQIDMKRQEDLQELHVYDRSLGMYHTLRRRMSPAEKVNFSIRKENGESTLSILTDMGLLG